MKGGILVFLGIAVFAAGFATGNYSSSKAGEEGLWADLHRTFSGEKILAEIPKNSDSVEKEEISEVKENVLAVSEEKEAESLKENFSPQQIVLNINMAGARVELKTDKVVLNPDNLESEEENLKTGEILSGGGKCEISDYKVPDRRGVYFSEVAWMGTNVSVNDEWIEIKNASQNDIDLSGWELRNKDGGLNMVFPDGQKIRAKEIMLFERGDDETVKGTKAVLIYKGALSNSDEGIYLFDASCNLVDKVETEGEWVAGDAKTKKTMERDWITLEWKDSLIAGGTPGSDNGVAVATSGGTVNNEEKEKESGEVLGSAAENGEVLEGGVCLSEVRVGSDGNADDEYIKAVNLGEGEINLEGWTIKKKSSTGAETTLVSTSLLAGKKIAGKGQMIFGHSEGYGGVADILWPKSYSLAYENNGVIFYDGTGKKIDEMNWEKLEKGEILKKECK